MILCIRSVREAELRQLRRQNTEYEEQNAILSKHVDNMKQAIEKLEVEATQQRSNNSALQQHLDLLRTTLVANFSRIPLPGRYSECTDWSDAVAHHRVKDVSADCR